jgi:hypothetical protein
MAREGNNNIVMKFPRQQAYDFRQQLCRTHQRGDGRTDQWRGYRYCVQSRFCINVLKIIPDEKFIWIFDTGISPCVIRPQRRKGLLSDRTRANLFQLLILIQNKATKRRESVSFFIG